MMQVLRFAASRPFARGPFKIRRIRPGLIRSGEGDPAFGPFSVVDHANLDTGTLVAMHEHVNDEILSYMWRGSMVHEDSAGHRVAIHPGRLMMMNAGKGFWHEESTPDGAVEMLQIFFRPYEADLTGEVQFFDRRPDILSGEWNLIAGPEGSDAPLTVRQRVLVYDVHLEAGEETRAPDLAGFSPWLYVMDGQISAGPETLQKGDALTDVAAPLPMLRATQKTSLVLFLVDLGATGSLSGTISGN